MSTQVLLGLLPLLAQGSATLRITPSTVAECPLSLSSVPSFNADVTLDPQTASAQAKSCDPSCKRTERGAARTSLTHKLAKEIELL
jgi:hypothetical protein